MPAPRPAASRPILLQRAYDDTPRPGAYRILVDRIWPRGLTKDGLRLDEWARELAPSTALRKWFGHDPQRWTEFQARYRAELDNGDARERMAALLAASAGKPLLLLYGAKDTEHNQAVVLRDVLLNMEKQAAA